MSVLRIISDIERTSDLCLRIVKLAPDHDVLAADVDAFSILRETASEFRAAIRA